MLSFSAQSQVDTTESQPLNIDSLRMQADSLSISLDSLMRMGGTRDSLPVSIGPDVPISKDALDDEVEYSARDTMIMDYQNRVIYMYGAAQVKYKTLLLKADYIRVNLDSSIATATGLPDSSGQIVGIPAFQDGDQSFTANKMKYNFKSQKGMVYDVVSEQGDIRILGAKTKFVSGRGADSLSTGDDVIYNRGAIITTCQHDVPHYGIRAAKIKTIPNKLAVVGASNLEIMGVPTPLWLPFGFYPVTPKNTAGPGLIFPRDYEYSNQWGFGLRNLGYYFPIKDWADMRLTGDIYFNGSYGLNIATSYVKKYKYRGNINLGYSARITEETTSYRTNRTNSFSIRVSHNQDTKAHPYQRIGGSINIQSNNFQALNQNDFQSAVTSSYSSNFSYNRRFADKPYTLNVAFAHSQNTRTKEVKIDFPTIDFKMNRIYPFKKKERVGKEKWFEKVSFRYDANAKSTFFATDSTIFSQMTLDDARFGVQHRMATDFNFDVFKYIHVTPSVSYDETWFFKTLEKDFIFNNADERFIQPDTIIDPLFPDQPLIVNDTVNFGMTEDRFVGGFVPFRNFSTSVSVNTQLFAQATFTKGWLRGVRHILKPSFSYSFSPRNYSDSYFRDVITDVRNPLELDTFSIFERGVYSARPQEMERQTLGFSFNNIFEAKYWSKRDTVAKKLKLFDNIYVSGNYNIAADSFNFSRISIRGTTRFFNRITTFSFMTSYDPYGLTEDGTRRSTEYFVKTDGKLLRFENLSLRFNSALSAKQLRELFMSDKKKAKAKKEDADSKGRPERGGLLTGVEDSFTEIFDNFRITHNLVINRMGRVGRDTTIVSTHTMSLRGSMKLSPNWAITVGNIGYNFTQDRLTYPDIGFTRDLHCWQLSFNWQPVRGTYSMYIGVKPGSLDFLKVPHRRNNVDSFGGF